MPNLYTFRKRLVNGDRLLQWKIEEPIERCCGCELEPAGWFISPAFEIYKRMEASYETEGSYIDNLPSIEAKEDKFAKAMKALLRLDSIIRKGYIYIGFRSNRIYIFYGRPTKEEWNYIIEKLADNDELYVVRE